MIKSEVWWILNSYNIGKGTKVLFDIVINIIISPEVIKSSQLKNYSTNSQITNWYHEIIVL